MDLDNKYALGSVVANDSESKTFRAREAATGREVFVHILFGGKPPGGRESLLTILLRWMTDATPEKRGQIIEISDYKGMPYAVTRVLPGFESMRAWVTQANAWMPQAAPAADPQIRASVWKVPAERPAAPAAPPPAAVAPQQPEDEFDRLFGVTPQAAPAAPAAPAPPAQHEGEFTRLFRSTVGDAQVPLAPPPPPAAPVRPAAAPPSYAPPPPPPLPPAPVAPAGQGPGEFTRMFEAAPFQETPAAPVRPPMSIEPEAAPAAPGEPQPGEFTRIFQTSSSPAAPAPPQASRGGFTGMFSSPTPAGPPASAPAPPPVPSQPAAPFAMPEEYGLQGQAPASIGGKPAGEFTQLFGARDKPGAPPPLASAPPPRPEARGATGVFSTPSASPAPPVGAQGPGEYTRVFGSQASYAATDVTPPQPAPMAPPMAAAPQAAPPAPKPQMPLLPIVIVSAVVVLSAMALALFFLLRK